MRPLFDTFARFESDKYHKWAGGNGVIGLFVASLSFTWYGERTREKVSNGPFLEICEAVDS